MWFVLKTIRTGLLNCALISTSIVLISISNTAFSQTSDNCDYSQAANNFGYGWNPVTQQSCPPVDDNGDCDYSQAASNFGYGWNPVTQQSCPPIDDNGNCDYSQAANNFGYGWNPVTQQSCPPIDDTGASNCARTALSAVNNPQSASVDLTNGKRFNITQGTCNTDFPDRTILPGSQMPAGQFQRGLRTYCMVSHYSYEDPVVNPPAGSKHLHMFWGNTGTDETTEVVDPNASSTCEGGVRNKSAYWMPALFDGQGRVVLPKNIITYYKTYGLMQADGSEDNVDPDALKDIPEGLQILANKDVKWKNKFSFTINDCPQVESSDCWKDKIQGGAELLKFNIKMPQCIKTDAAGNPLTRAETGMPINSHLAYAKRSVHDPESSGAFLGSNFCPVSHPYRIPQVELVAYYSTAGGGLGDWKLASDIMSGSPGGSTLHGDYIASWERGHDDSAMSFMVACNANKDDCGHGTSNQQLPERFESAWGTVIYDGTTELIDEITRPFIFGQPSATR
jgi:hypothetical protein